MIDRVAPGLFVLMWSTGFIFSKLGAADAEPFTFLLIRFLLVIAILAPVAALMGAPRLTPRQRISAAVAGLMLHGIYLGGVFWAIRNGLPAGVTALIVSLQPVLTATLVGPLLGERVGLGHWIGLAIGLLGSLLVLAPKLAVSSEGFTAATIAASVLALFGISLGTIWQKRRAGGIHLASGAVWQFSGAAAGVGLAALATETFTIRWTPTFVLSLGWLVLVLSIGAISLLLVMIRRNAVSRVSALFYLVTPVTALMAWALFGETLSPLQIAGVVLASLAVVQTEAAARRMDAAGARS